MQKSFAELIASAEGKDQEAISELYNRTYPGVYKTAKAIIQDEDAVLDIVQDTYIKAFQNLHQLDAPDKFPAWVKRIAVNQAKDYLKKKKPMTACGKTKLDVADGVTVVFSGADGNGYAELIHDEENPSEMAPKFLLKLVKDKKVAADDWQKLMTIGSAVSYDLDKSSKLSNGDTVTVTISVDKDVLNNLKMTAEPAKLTFTVKGLTEPTIVHPFEDYSVSFDGVSPGVQVKDFIDARKIDDVIVHYGIEESKPYRAGQELTVKAWIAAEDRDNYKLSEDTMTVTVTGVDEYVLDINDIKPDTLDTMRAKADAVIAEYLRKWEGFYSYNGFEYVGCEFYSREVYSGGHANYVYLYYKINANDAGEDFSSYYFVRFNNVLQHQDGTQEVDLEYYDVPPIMFYATLKDYQTLESRTSEIHSRNDNGFISQQKFE